jgi:hypothetical protein
MAGPSSVFPLIDDAQQHRAGWNRELQEAKDRKDEGGTQLPRRDAAPAARLTPGRLL